MKSLISAVLLLLTSVAAHALPMHYYGEVTGSGDYSGQVTSNSAWVNPPVFGLNSFGEQQVNLWGFDAAAGQTLALNVSSNDDFIGGISLYYGEVSANDLLLGGFNNSGDIGAAQFIASTSTFMADTWINELVLDLAGFYTIIVGGKSGFGFAPSYDYLLSVTTTVPVPEPAGIALLALGLAGLVASRRRMAR